MYTIFQNGSLAKLIAGIDKNDKKDYIDELSEKYENNLNEMKFNSPLIFIIKEKMINDKFYVQQKILRNIKIQMLICKE